MFRDTGPIFTFQDEVLETKGDYQKLRRRVFSNVEPFEEMDSRISIDRFVGPVIDERICVGSEDCAKGDLVISRYFEEFAVDFRPQSKSGLLTFYLRDPYSTERKRLVEGVYKQDGLLDHLIIYQLPRYSFQRMVAGMTMEMIEREELIERFRGDIGKYLEGGPGDFLADMENAFNALDVTSFSEISRMKRVVDLGGFFDDRDFYINLDGQQQIKYGQPARFNDRLVIIDHDKDKGTFLVSQSALANGYYQSCSIELSAVIPNVSRIGLGLPNQSWRNFFDELCIKPSVIKSNPI